MQNSNNDPSATRRAVLSSLSGVAAASTLAAPASAAGSASTLTTLTYESTPAAVDLSVASQSALDLSATQQPTITQSVLGIDVEATNWTALYNNVDLDEDPNAIEAGTAKGFAVVTTPDLEFLGFQLNPLANTDNEAILEEFGRLGENFQGVPSLDSYELLEEETITIFDQETTLSTFDTTGTSAGTEVELIQYVAAFEYEDDAVIAIGFHSKGIDAKDELLPLFGNLQYDIDPDTLPDVPSPSN
jgi:hypothetical protein